MESKEGKKSLGVTVANIVSLLALVLFFVFSLFGHPYKSGGEPAWDVLIPIGITAAIVLLLWLLIKVKGAENDLKKSRFAEVVLGVLYVGMVFVSLTQSGITHFFNATAEKENIKKYAKDDLGKIDALFEEYENFEREALSRTQTGLMNAIIYGYDDGLQNFMTDNRIESTETGVNEYTKFYERELFGSEHEVCHNDFKVGRQAIENAVDNWNTRLVGRAAGWTVAHKDSVEARLTRLSRNAKLPVISKYADGYRYGLGEMQEREYRIEGELQFKKALQDAGGFNIKALVIVLVIHLLILFSYFVAYRTKTLGPRTDREYDGGITL